MSDFGAAFGVMPVTPKPVIMYNVPDSGGTTSFATGSPVKRPKGVAVVVTNKMSNFGPPNINDCTAGTGILIFCTTFDVLQMNLKLY